MDRFSKCGGFFAAIFIASGWACSAAAESVSVSQYSDEDALPADIFLRLSSLHCGNCTLVVRDLIEAGAVENRIGAVKAALNDNLNYMFRLNLLTSCSNCYRAAHFWEINMLNRPAEINDISHWLNTQESKPLIEYFSKH